MADVTIINCGSRTTNNAAYTYLHPPLGPLSIVTHLRAEGMTVDFTDLWGKDDDRRAEVVSKIEPNSLVGLSCSSINFDYAQAIAEDIKQSRGATVVLGGPHATFCPEESISDPNIDFIVLGEGEIPLQHIIRARGDVEQLDGIPGLGWKTADGSLRIRPAGEFMEPADMPYIDYSIWDADDMEACIRYNESHIGFRSIGIMASRGCPYKCSFCAASAAMGTRARYYETREFVDYLLELAEKYRCDGFWFKDSTFTINKGWVHRFCDELLSRGARLQWACQTRADTVNDKMLVHMKEAGLHTLWVGADSGSERILESLNKGTTVERIRQTIEMCHRYNVRIATWFMVGTPEETMEDVEMTFEFARQVNADVYHWSIFSPLPGSAIYDKLKAEGGLPPDLKFSELAYDQATMDTKHMKREQIQAVFDRICDHFYNNSQLGDVWELEAIPQISVA